MAIVLVVLLPHAHAQDQPPTAGGITWKDWVAQSIRSEVEPLRVLVEERFRSTAHALVVAREELLARLDHSNNQIAAAKQKEQEFARKEEVAALADRLARVELWRSAQEGDFAGRQRGSEPMLTVVWIIVAGVVGAMISLIVARFPQNQRRQ